MTRKQLLLVATFVAGILSVASIGWACITFVGDMQVRSTRSSSDSDLVTGKGGTSSMQYCSSGAAGPSTAAKATPGTHTITVQVWTASGCNTGGTNKFAAGSGATAHEIRLRGAGSTGAYTGADGTGWTFVSGMGCWASTPPPGTLIGSLDVDASGNGTKSGISLSGYGFSANDSGEASVVCAGNGANQTGFGNFVPLVIL